MKKLMVYLMGVALMLASCNEKQNKADEQINALRDSLTQIISQKDAELNDIMGTFNDIQEGFREINEAQGRVNLDKSNPERMSKEDIIENISFIQRTMQLNKSRITRLEEQLKASSFNVSKLQETLDELNKQMEQKQQQIDDLTAQLKEKDIQIEEQGKTISTLNENVSSLTSENTSKSQTVARQDKELNTAWYVFGTKKELKEQKILNSGDVLKEGNFNQSYFTKIDIRVVKSVKLYSKSAKLMTSHPSGSYTLDRDASKQYTLHITNPEKFWSVSKYLVIVVK
ncbi:MAG: hypothetical protein KBT27_00880 [Prevotellaceae bacterium]|nr:hypothetical protein [Candidatus Faecinaster equi]